MSSILPSRRVLGPCFIKTRNVVFYSKGNVTITERLSEFEIAMAKFGVTERREDTLTYEIALEPAGRLNALGILWPFGSSKIGDLLHATAKVTGINAGTNVVTFDSLARFRDGSPVRLGTTINDAPAGITAGNLYYLHKLSSTTATFHTTEADALGAANAVDITDAGTGTHTIIEEDYLIIQPMDGSAPEKWHNTVLLASPAMRLGGNRTAIGPVTFEAFRRFNTAATDNESFYGTTDPIADTSFDFADIKTEPFSLAWGAAVPWSQLFPRDGITVEFPLGTTPWGDDGSGIASRVITSLGAQATATPAGLTEADIFAKRTLQGAGAGRGRRIVSTDALNIVSATADLLYVRLNGAILTDPGALNWDSVIERTGQLAWQAQRVVTAGVPGDLYYVGASAPA